MTTKRYSNGKISIIWEPGKCIHSTVCWKAHTGLPEVFDPRRRPWIDQHAAPTEQLIEQVSKCPSGALRFEYEDLAESAKTPEPTLHIEVLPNGPVLVKGTFSLKHSDGSEQLCENSTALCRCGASANKPFCDGSHKKIDFKG